MKPSSEFNEAVAATPSPGSSVGKRQIDFARSGPYFAALLAVALIAFWPTYLSRPLGSSSIYIHLHAVTATLWILTLIAQPLAIRSGHLRWHRAVGRGSYVLAPVILVAMVLLAHSRIQNLEGAAYAEQTYILYLQVSLATLFAVSYGLAIINRGDTGLHARFMVCTGLTLIDPVVIRLLFWIDPGPGRSYQWVTFGLTDLVIIALIVLEPHRRSPRAVFKAMLLVFVLAQLPALLQLTDAAPWQSFAAWFAALPLT